MSVKHVPRHAAVVADSAGPDKPARWAVGIAAGSAAVVLVGVTTTGVAYALGGDQAISDNWVGYLGGLAVLGGMATSFVAFALAVLAKLRRERWSPLWLPLSLFPALLATLVLLELFVLE